MNKDEVFLEETLFIAEHDEEPPEDISDRRLIDVEIKQSNASNSNSNDSSSSGDEPVDVLKKKYNKSIKAIRNEIIFKNSQINSGKV